MSGALEFQPAPVTGPAILARIATVGAGDAVVALSGVPAVSRPIGLAIALSQTHSQFMRNARIGKPPSVRAFNALHFS